MNQNSSQMLRALKERLRLRGLRQKAVADELGYSLQTLNRFLNYKELPQSVDLFLGLLQKSGIELNIELGETRSNSTPSPKEASEFIAIYSQLPPSSQQVLMESIRAWSYLKVERSS